MGYRRYKTKKAYAPKRRYKRRKRRCINYSPHPGRPFADKYKFNMRYCQQIALSSSAGVFGFNTFSMNSLYDPDTTGGVLTNEHQPMGFDQLATIYNRYCVTGAKITATFAFSPSDATPSWCGITLHENSSFIGSTEPIEALMEQGKTVYRCLSAGNGGNPIVTLTKKVSCRKEFSVPNLLNNIEEYGALVNTSPANGLFSTVWIQGIGEAATPGCDIMVKIEYTGYFTEPVLLAQS